MSQILPVSFKNKDGLTLSGILHVSPNAEAKKVGVVFLNPGIKSRVAPHRLYIKMARRFVDLGLSVLRFDPHGQGDSEGKTEETRSEDFFASIQVGRFVEDTIWAMNWMSKNYGCKSFILAGLCGGAITALLTSWKDDRVKGILGLGIPVLIETGNDDYFKIMSSGQLRHHYEGYLTKIFSPKAWFRFLSFQSNHYVILKSLANRFFPNYFVSRSQKKSCESTADTGINKYFMPAVKSMVSAKGKILFIFSEKDRLHWEFQEKLFSGNRSYFESSKDYVEIHIERNANHLFTLQEWQRNVLTISSQWISTNFCCQPS